MATTAQTPARPRPRGGLDPGRADVYRDWLRQMVLIRRFEEKAGEAYSLGKIGGFGHLYIGQEAVGVGSLAVLAPDDYITCSYREHGHALARGMSARTVMAELFGKAPGCSKGKGGSMHLFDASLGFLGGHSIMGGHIPLATGNESDSLLALVDGKWLTLRVPYPMGFYGKGIDGRIDDPRAGGKGKGVYSSVSTRAPFHMETGKGTLSKLVKWQMRPNPLSK